MDKWSGRVALVTGSSVGIGADICATLVKYGLNVIGCARQIQKIQELKESLKNEKGSLTAIQCDVSQEDQVTEMFSAIKKSHGGIDICINNAGVNVNSTLIDGVVADWKYIMNVNVIGLTHCCQMAIKSLRERDVKDGYIINICSILGHIVPPEGFFHFYTASKFAVKAITDGFRHELRALKSTIRICQLSPSRTRSEMHRRTFKLTDDEVEEFFSSTGYLDSCDVTAAVINVLSQPSYVEVVDCIFQSVNMPVYGKTSKLLTNRKE